MSLRKKIKRKLRCLMTTFERLVIEIKRFVIAFVVHLYLRRNSKEFIFSSGGLSRIGYIPKEKVNEKLFDYIGTTGWIATRLRRYKYRFFRISKVDDAYKIKYYVF